MTSTIPNLASLLKQTSIDDHDARLKAANNVLKHSKKDLEAQHIRIIAYLKLDRFDDALRAFETGGEALQAKARLEYAYALYKSAKPEDAARIATQGEGRGYQHVEAQASYRIEDFKRASELYAQLAAHSGEDTEADLRINSGAVDAQLEWTGRGDLVHKKKPSREDLEAFETAYNAACGSIARGELGQGEVLLKRAVDLCNALEDLSAEEEETELLPITLQQVYVLARQGKSEQAEKVAQSVHVEKIPDASTKFIAQVNKEVAGGSPANSYLAQRLAARDPKTLAPDVPFHFQTAIIDRNRYAVDLQTLKLSGTAESTAALIAKSSTPSLDANVNTLSVVNAAAHAKSQTGKEALKHILPLLEKRPTDVGLILTIVQLYVLTGNSASAINLLEAFLRRLEQSGKAADLDVRFAPGLVAAMTSLYATAGRSGHLHTEYAKAAAHWRRKSKSDQPAGVATLLKAAGSALAESQEAEHQQLAKDIFTDLHNHDKNDHYALVGLLASSTSSDTEKASSLHPISRLLAHINTDTLESAGIAQPASTNLPPPSRKRAAPTPLPDNKPKKLRKSRIPKDYDPSKKPDPERWLPLRDRSTYRPKGKKGKAKQNLLSQGAVGDSEGSRPTTPGGEVLKGKAPAPGKKKGKGKK